MWSVICLLPCFLPLAAADFTPPSFELPRTAPGESVPDFEDIPARISGQSPRLFLNAGQIDAIRSQPTANREAFLEQLRERGESYPEAPQIDPDTIAEAVWLRDENTDWGSPAMDTALLYRMSGEDALLEKAANLVETAIESYRLRYAHGKAISWTIWTRLATFAAYDWIREELPPERSRAIGEALFAYVRESQQLDALPDLEGVNRPVQGFYGVAVLPWYAGLVFHDVGIDDEQALAWLRQGYEDHKTMFYLRSYMAGARGGSVSVAYNYASGPYYHAEFNFYLSAQAAFGHDFTRSFPNLGLLPHWLLWNAIPGKGEGEFFEFGLGDVLHANGNRVSLPQVYLSEYDYFYSDRYPEMTVLVADMLEQAGSFDLFGRYLDEENHFSFIPLLMDLEPDGDAAVNRAELESVRDRLPRAQHFDRLGQVVMNSGWSPGDTYATYVAGAALDRHKHRDENHFIIHRRGFLALDAGTRGSTAAYRDMEGIWAHQYQYYIQSIAHNTVLVAPPEPVEPDLHTPEIMDDWFQYPVDAEDEDLPEMDPDGGIISHLGGEVLAFESNDEYVYIASDAAGAYHPHQVDKVQRQFVFVPPDYFIIFDRVVSPEAHQRKTWLLQTQNEPSIDGDLFRADHWDGRLMGRTLLPEDADLKKVGGPDERFLSRGKNWSFETVEHLPEYTDEDALFGDWRLEVSSAVQEREQYFLHLLQVGDRVSLEEMVRSVNLSNEAYGRVAFEAVDGRRVTVAFNKEGSPGGHIRIWHEGETLVERPFADEVVEVPLVREEP